jgi:hypothetical protein
MSDELVKYKEEAINRHFQNFVNVINKMNERIDDALRDEQKKLNIGADFLNTAKGSFAYDHNSTLGMTSSDKLKYAESWFTSKQNDIQTLKEISTESQKSFLNTLDEEIEQCRAELNKMKDAQSQ